MNPPKHRVTIDLDNGAKAIVWMEVEETEIPTPLEPTTRREPTLFEYCEILEKLEALNFQIITPAEQ